MAFRWLNRINHQLLYPFCTLPQEPVKSVVQITSKTAINHDSYVYRLKFIKNPFELGIGGHFRIVQNIKTYESPEGEQVVRKYTPINPLSQKDSLDLLVKIYRPNADIKFPNGGKLTPYIQSLNVGDKMHIEGPLGHFGYEAGNNLILDGEKKKFKRIFFIAGGSGITPCYHVINEISKMPNQNIQMTLLFANKTEEDILLKKQLEALRPRINLHYMLDNPPTNWTGFKGYATKQLLQSIHPLNDEDTAYIYCGPFHFNKWMRQLFKTHYPESTLFKF